MALRPQDIELQSRVTSDSPDPNASGSDTACDTRRSPVGSHTEQDTANASQSSPPPNPFFDRLPDESRAEPPGIPRVVRNLSGNISSQPLSSQANTWLHQTEKTHAPMERYFSLFRLTSGEVVLRHSDRN